MEKNSKTALSFIKYVVLEVSTELEWQNWELSLPKYVGQRDDDRNGLQLVCDLRGGYYCRVSY